MFCPNCGRDNSGERKFCAFCGTNLEAVSQALSALDDDFFTRIDAGLDQFLARYSEHVFKNAPANASEQKVGKSWQVLGQSIVTSLVDLILFILMWNVIPLRLLLLLISTPIRLLREQGKGKRSEEFNGRTPAQMPDSAPQQWLPGSIDSITEHTTAILVERDPRKPDRT